MSPRRRLLGSVRAVLRAVRHPRRAIRRAVGKDVHARPPRRSGPTASKGRPRSDQAPIHPIGRADYVSLRRRFPYYKGRWTYMSVACSIAADLIERHDLRSALELGPHLRSIIVGADVMDLQIRPDLEAEGKVIAHDATAMPWPVADKGYDLFVALQVFEHLGDAQRQAFDEVRRIARHAIISLPIDWVEPDPTNCHHGITHERALSWFEPIVPTRVVVGNPGKRKRLIYVFEDLESPR